MASSDRGSRTGYSRLGLNDFFEPPPPPPRREPVRSPRPWIGAPRGTLPGVVALELVLAENDRFAVCISHLAVYPTGFAFEAFAFAAPVQDERELPDPLMLGPARDRPLGSRGLPDQLLRFGVQFSDGRKATNTGDFLSEPDETPDAPVMRFSRGGGGGGLWHLSGWVWPLPPPGPTAFVCQWPAAGIPLTRREIDDQLIPDAAGRAQMIYQDES